MIQGIIIIILLIYAIFVSYLLFDQYQNREKYFKDKSEYIDRMTQNLTIREREVLDREMCDKELKILKKIHTDALDILMTYNRYLFSDQNNLSVVNMNNTNDNTNNNTNNKTNDNTQKEVASKRIVPMIK